MQPDETKEKRTKTGEFPHKTQVLNAVIYLVEVVGVQVAGIVDVAKHEPQEVVPSAGLLVILIVVVIWKLRRGF